MPTQSPALPAELNHFSPANLIDAQQNDFLDSSLYVYPATKDDLASDKLAIRLDDSKKGDRPLRFYPWPYAVLYQDYSWKAYAVVRAEVKENQSFAGKAFDVGMIDLETMTYPIRKTIDLSVFSDKKHHVIEIGSFRKRDLHHLQNYLFFELQDNENLKSILVDRIILAH